jgi:hypothetical protein
VSNPELWKLFWITVEGRQHSQSCALKDGNLQPSEIPILKGAQPDLKLLAEFLRSDIPLPQSERNWLADLMDKDATSDFQFKKLSKRAAGRPVGGQEKKIAMARYFNDLQHALTRKRALHKTAMKFRVSPATIERALKSTKDEPRAQGDLDDITL